MSSDAAATITPWAVGLLPAWTVSAGAGARSGWLGWGLCVFIELGVGGKCRVRVIHAVFTVGPRRRVAWSMEIQGKRRHNRHARLVVYSHLWRLSLARLRPPFLLEHCRRFSLKQPRALYPRCQRPCSTHPHSSRIPTSGFLHPFRAPGDGGLAKALEAVCLVRFAVLVVFAVRVRTALS